MSFKLSFFRRFVKLLVKSWFQDTKYKNTSNSPLLIFDSSGYRLISNQHTILSLSQFVSVTITYSYSAEVFEIWMWLRTIHANLLGELIHFGHFSPRETTFVASCLLKCIPGHFWKRIYTVRKEFAPSGSKFFPYSVDPFSEGGKIILTKLSPLKMYQSSLKGSDLISLKCGALL